jgi:NAD(P)-dependent dehydrogenase (short-subunit alcohol dehydrogenase family)
MRMLRCFYFDEFIMLLSHKYALVTGSSRGIGKAIALKLAKQGAKIAVHYYQNQEAAKETLLEIQQLGSDGIIVQGDVSQPKEIQDIFDRILDLFGKLDIFVSNARPELPKFNHTPLEMTLDHWRSAMDSQAQAFLVGTQQAVSLMPDGSRIIAITYSPSGRGSWQPWTTMGTAKAALDSLCRYFAVALGERGITVNAVSPGCIFSEPCSVDAGVLYSLPQIVQRTIQSWHENGWTPMKRLGTPEDIANAVMLLCMQEASFITGQIFNVDGGASIMNSTYPLDVQLGR